MTNFFVPNKPDRPEYYEAGCTTTIGLQLQHFPINRERTVVSPQFSHKPRQASITSDDKSGSSRFLPEGMAPKELAVTPPLYLGIDPETY